MFSDITQLSTWIDFGTFFITAIGGYFIIQTFILQAKTSADQTEVLKIQQHEFRLKFLPILQQLNLTKGIKENATDILTIVVTEHPIKRLEYKIFADEGITVEPWYVDPDLLLNTGHRIKFSINYLISEYISAQITNIPFSVKIEFQFVDTNFNRYRQDAVYKFGSSIRFQEVIFLGKN